MERVCAFLRERITKTQACAESAHRKRGKPPWPCLELFQGQSHPDGAVIRSHDFREDEGRTELGCQRGGYPAIIDPPAHIPGTSPCTITPPRIMASSLLEGRGSMSRIDQSIEEARSSGLNPGFLTFSLGQARSGWWATLSLRRKEQALLPQSRGASKHPFKAVVQASQCILGIGGVDIDQSERINSRFAPFFLIILLEPRAFRHAKT